MTRTRSKVFYGWWITLTSALGLFIGPIPIAVFSFGVFIRPLTREFHSGRGAVSFAGTLLSLSFALGSPLAGRLVDRLGARKVILPCVATAGLILISASFISGSIWQLYVFYFALGLATSGAAPVSYCHVISHWFDRYRGLALGVMMLGLGLGALIMPAAAQSLITTVGWRTTFGIVGLAILVITVPAGAMFLKDRPEPLGLVPDGRSYPSEVPSIPNADLGLSWREAWHDSTFWVFLCVFFLVAASVHACLAHVASILADRGTSAQAAALATSLFGGGVLVGRTASGYLLDRFFAPRVAAVIFGCAAAGIALLRIASSDGLAFTAAFFVGLGLGAEVDIMAYLTSRYFGLRSFGAIYGVIFAVFGLAGGLGTYVMGAVFDATGSYALTLASFCVATLIGAALMMRLGPYRYRIRQPGESRPELEMLPSES